MTQRAKFILVATAFDRKKKIIGQGVNDYRKSHPLSKLYAEKAGESSDKIYKHAEWSALLAAGNKSVHSMLIQRFTKQGEPALAKPCKTCQVMLKDFGVKYVEYTSESGIIWQDVSEF